MTLSLFLDFALIVLLAVTIGYAASLNRKLAALRRNKAEMEKLAAQFAQSTVKAEDGISRLRTDTASLQTLTGKAQGLRDDLAFLTERANAAADRLENVIRASRTRAPAAAAPSEPKVAANARGADEDGIDARSEAERELLKALRAAV